MKKIILTHILIIFLATKDIAQNRAIDSLQSVLITQPDDTIRVNTLNGLCWELLMTNYPDKAKKYSDEALILSKKLNYKKGEAKAINNTGIFYQAKSDYSEALKNYYLSLKLNEEIGYKKEIGFSYQSVGAIYSIQGNYSEGNKNFMIALKIYQQIDEKEGIGYIYSNFGNNFMSQGNYPEAMKNFLASLKIKEQTGNRGGIALAYCNIGYIYLLQGNYSEALKNYLSALKISESTGRKNLLARCHIGIGWVHLRLKNYSESEKELNEVLFLLRESGYGENYKDVYQALTELDSAKGKWKDAFMHHKLFIAYRDSLRNEENARKTVQTQMQYEYDKKETLSKAEQDKKDIEATSELKHQKQQRNYFIAGFSIVLILAAFIFREYRQKQKANTIVTRQKEEVEKQRDQADKQRLRAEQSEKFKQQFIANMSHEIRTPMNAVMGMTNLLIDKNPRDDQQIYLTGIQKSSGTLLHIINDILDLSKIEAGKIQLEEIDFSIHDVIDQVVHTLQHKANEKGLKLLTEIDDKVPNVVIGDPVRLNQILMNLAGNAIKFTEKGSVKIYCESGAENLEFKYKSTTQNLQSEKVNLRFRIKDTGIGIPAEKLQSVFESFSQAHSSDTRRFGGTGLGLTISKELVELQGGKISIESNEGSGSTFSFEINYQVGSAKRLNEQKSAEEIDGTILNGLNILLADDNEFNRMVARDTLISKADVEIAEATNGKEVLEILMQKDFDVILMDVQMPLMDGYEATRNIRQNFNSPKNATPVIALTASVVRSDLDKCLKAGMNGYVPKPFKTSQLFTAIASATGRSLSPNLANQSGSIELNEFT